MGIKRQWPGQWWSSLVAKQEGVGLFTKTLVLVTTVFKDEEEGSRPVGSLSELLSHKQE